MKYTVRDLCWLLLVLPLAGVTLYRTFIYESVTLKSLSPDDQWLVTLVERPRFIDRNFELRLKDESSYTETRIFTSPDEGLHVGSERILWSPDSTQFVLLGRHFITDGRGALPNGEVLYLLYDLDSGELKCNAHQQSVYEPFDLSDIPWFESCPSATSP